MDNLVGITGEELLSHGIADILGDTHHITQLFFSVSRVYRVDSLGINFVPEWKTKNDADVNGVAGEMLEGNVPIKGGVGEMIHDEYDVA
jgi:hypothetical protein